MAELISSDVSASCGWRENNGLRQKCSWHLGHVYAFLKKWMCRRDVSRDHVGALYLAFRPSLSRVSPSIVRQHPTPSRCTKSRASVELFCQTQNRMQSLSKNRPASATAFDGFRNARERASSSAVASGRFVSKFSSGNNCSKRWHQSICKHGRTHRNRRGHGSFFVQIFRERGLEET